MSVIILKYRVFTARTKLVIREESADLSYEFIFCFTVSEDILLKKDNF